MIKQTKCNLMKHYLLKMFFRRKVVLFVFTLANIFLFYNLILIYPKSIKLVKGASFISSYAKNLERKNYLIDASSKLEGNNKQTKNQNSDHREKVSQQNSHQVELLQIQQINDAVKKSNINKSNRLRLNKQKDKTKTCPIHWDEKWLEKNMGRSVLEPMINLDKTKFLLPVPTNGPNNQLVGTRESLYVAIRLNRTLVVPQLFKHRTDDQLESNKLIHPGHRIDLEKLSKLIPCVTVDYFRDVCKHRVKAIFRVREMTINKYRKIEDNLNMTILKRIKGTNDIDRKKPFSAIYEYPLNKKLNKKLKYFDIPPDASSVRQLYPSEEPCVIHPSLFRNLKIREQRPSPEEPTMINLQKISNVDLYSEIIRFTPSPKHIVKMAEDFIANVIKGRPYLSLHWRFDREDWMRRCLAPNPWGTKGRIQMCHTILSFKPISIARVISNRASNISNSLVTVKDVYIAYPLVERDVMDNVTRLLRNKFSLNVFTHTDVLKYWKKKYNSCEWLWPDHLDILSTTEMEICGRGKNFFHSVQSTWSKNVCLSRLNNPEERHDCADKKDITYYVKMYQNISSEHL